MEEEVRTFINYIHDNNPKIILARRNKNIIFCKKYQVCMDMIIFILSKLNYFNFVDILENDNKNYGREYLYIFAPVINYLNKDNIYNRQIYLKLNLFKDKNILVIISLHEAKYKLNYKYGDDAYD